MMKRSPVLPLALALLLGLLPLSACESPSPPPAEPPAVLSPETEPAPGLQPEIEPDSEPELQPETKPEPEPEPRRVQYVHVLVNGLNLRAEADIACAVLGQAERGALLQFSGMQGDWYRTAYRGGEAYVSADPRYTELIGLPSADARTEEVIREGFRLLGTPYVYGATRVHDGKGGLLKGFSEWKFDCSSLMQYIFFRGADVLLDVTTRTQIVQGRAAEDPQRGDLLFFTNAARRNRTGIERVGHVALFLGGDYILHTASDYARAEKLTAQRKADFLAARRVL